MSVRGTATQTTVFLRPVSPAGPDDGERYLVTEIVGADNPDPRIAVIQNWAAAYDWSFDSQGRSRSADQTSGPSTLDMLVEPS